MRVLSAQKLFTGSGFLTETGVLVRDGTIRALVRPGQVPEGASVQDFGAGILAPGFVDAQVNGGGGVLVNATPTAPALARLAAAHARYGTTAILPTVITDRFAVREAAFDAVRAAEAAGTPGILGIHFEGPFLNPERRGVHPARWLTVPDAAEHDLMTAAHPGVSLVTLAPECVPAAVLERLVAAGVRVCAGHSAADAAGLQQAFASGVSGFTHLFNATGPLAARTPGPAGIALDAPGLVCGLIADGYHVDPLLIRLAWRLKGPTQLMLVSDAMPPAAGGPDRFQLGDRAIRVQDGRCLTPEGGLAGSAATLGACVRVCVEQAGLPTADVLTMATATPAAYLGCAHRCGRLAPGRAADMVLLDARLNVLRTWVQGAPVDGPGPAGRDAPDGAPSREPLPHDPLSRNGA